MYILLVFLAVSSVNAHDINVGSNTEGKKVFDEHFQASPAVWRQAQNVTINTTDDEVISRIVVTDLREDKDGDAKIVDGGKGQKKVTIELKSPTVLRGYDFKVEVYAAPQKDYQNQKNGPVNPSEFKSNAGSLNSPKSGSKITPPSGSQSIPNNNGLKESKARETRDTEVKKLEENSPKIESPSTFGQKAITTAKPGNKDSNVPFTIGNRQFIKDTEDDDETTKIPSLKTNTDEVRHVRDAREDDSTFKSPPKQGSFDSKTTTTTNKTPSYNLNRNNPVASYPESVANEGRDVSTTSIFSQSNPTFYTPNFEGNYPSLVNSEGINKDKPFNDQSKKLNDQKRNARDTQAESKETNTPQITSLTGPAVANKRAENVTNDEERKTRSAQEGPKMTPLNVDIKEVTSTTASTILTYQDDETSSPKSPGVLTKTQNYPVPYPYEATTKAGSTTKSAFKRDTESQKSETNKNLKSFGTFETTTRIASTTKSPVKRDTESSEEHKADDKNVKLNAKIFSNFETTTKISSTTKSPFKRDTESSEKPEADDKNVKFNPKSLGTFETSTKDQSTTKSPVKRDIESTEAKADDKNVKLNPKSFGTFETTTKYSITTKSPFKRDTESSEKPKADDKNVKFNPKSIGTFETSTKDQSTTKSPVKRYIESTEAKADEKNVKLNPKSFGTFETTTKYSITTKSPSKRDTEESKVTDSNFKVIPKALGSQNATSHDHRMPVVSLQNVPWE